MLERWIVAHLGWSISTGCFRSARARFRRPFRPTESSTQTEKSACSLSRLTGGTRRSPMNSETKAAAATAGFWSCSVRNLRSAIDRAIQPNGRGGAKHDEPHQETQGKGGVLATKAVETQGKGDVLATEAVETQGKGSVLEEPFRTHPLLACWRRSASDCFSSATWQIHSGASSRASLPLPSAHALSTGVPKPAWPGTQIWDTI